MAEDHKPLPVAGYTAQPDAKVALVNRFKEMEERLLREIERARDELFPSAMMWTETDEHFMHDAIRHIQIGFMLLNRAVFQPQRIKLPEDSE